MIDDQHCALLIDGWESASISDDDEDGEWVDVHHSSDEDTGEVVRVKMSWWTTGGQSHLATVFLMWDVSVVAWRRRSCRASPSRRGRPWQRRSAAAGSSLRTTSRRSVWSRWPRRSTPHQARARRGKLWTVTMRRRGEEDTWKFSLLIKINH